MPTCAKCGNNVKKVYDCNHTNFEEYCVECYTELHYYLTEKNWLMLMMKKWLILCLLPWITFGKDKNKKLGLWPVIFTNCIIIYIRHICHPRWELMSFHHKHRIIFANPQHLFLNLNVLVLPFSHVITMYEYDITWSYQHW